MLLCSCTRTSEQSVCNAILGGAETPQQIAERCRAGSRCGGCVPRIEALLEQETRVVTGRVAHSAA
jgi:NAD(P)H-nitrite reductase large subunit